MEQARSASKRRTSTGWISLSELQWEIWPIRWFRQTDLVHSGFSIILLRQRLFGNIHGFNYFSILFFAPAFDVARRLYFAFSGSFGAVNRAWRCCTVGARRIRVLAWISGICDVFFVLLCFGRRNDLAFYRCSCCVWGLLGWVRLGWDTTAFFCCLASICLSIYCCCLCWLAMPLRFMIPTLHHLHSVLRCCLYFALL